MQVKQFFETHPVFHYEEFSRFMEQQGVTKPASCRQQLSYYHKTGRLVHLRRLLYAVKPSTAGPDFWIDPYLIASKATQDAVLAYHTALEIHGLAYTTFEKLTYLSSTMHKAFSSQSQEFRSVLFPKVLMEHKNTHYGIMTMQRQGMSINVTNIERTIVDVLDRPGLGGGWEEIWRSSDHILNFDIEQVLKYTLMLRNATIVAKVGFFLEQRPPHLSVAQHIIDQLLPYIPKQPHYMNRDQRRNSKYIQKWQLYVPEELIKPQWDEPYADNH
jgi:predicted transcriptional regulator of viral defense system